MKVENGNNETFLKSIPFDWELMPLGKIFEAVDRRIRDFQIEENEIPILSMTRSNGLVLQTLKFDKRVASRDISNYKVVRQGELVYGFPIDEGVIAILHRYPIGAVSPAYQVWKPILEVDLGFIDYMLKAPAMINVYRKFSSNVVERRRTLSKRDFVRINVPLPPISEQKSIARILYTVHQYIDATDRVIAAALEVKRTLMKQLLVDNLHNTPFEPLGKNVKILTGGTPNTKNINYWNGDIHWVSSKDVSEAEGPFITRTERMITVAGIKNSAAKILPSYTVILIARGATMGKVRLIKTPMAMNQTCYGLAVNEDNDQLYLYYMMSMLRDSMLSISYGTIFTTVTRGILSQLPLKFPALEEQRRVSTILFAVDSKIQAEKNIRNSLVVLFQSLLSILFTGRIRINI